MDDQIIIIRVRDGRLAEVRTDNIDDSAEYRAILEKGLSLLDGPFEDCPSAVPLSKVCEG